MLKKLSKRQKYGVYAAVGVLCLFIFLQFILFPVLDNRGRLRRSLQVKTKTLADMQQLRAEFLLTTQRSDDLKKRFARRTKGFTLFSFLDKLARDAGVKDSITYMKPSNTVQKNTGIKISTIEMKLQSVALPKLTDYLYRVETSENMVSIKRASFIKKEKEKGSLDVILQVETFDI